MPAFLSWLPPLPITPELGLILSALVISLAAGLMALIRNRRLITAPSEDGGDLGMLFDNPASILPHVMELHDRLIKSFIAIGIATLVALLLTDQLLAVMAQPAGGLDELQAIRVTEPFGVFFRISIVVGVILASPFVIVQLWIFVAAGLRPSERRWFYLFVPFAIILFMIGVAFAYAVMLPVARIYGDSGTSHLRGLRQICDQCPAVGRHQLRDATGDLHSGQSEVDYREAACPELAHCNRDNRDPGGGRHAHPRPD